MDPLVGLLETERSGDAPVLISGRRRYDARRFRQTAYRTGNYLRHCGVHDGAVVEILDVPAPETVFGFLGSVLLGGVVDLDSRGSGNHAETANGPAVKVLLGPTNAVSGRDVDPGCTPIGYGDEPDDPAVAYFERETWSENPIFPDVDLDTERTFLAGADVSLAEAIERAGAVAKRLPAESSVAIRSPCSEPGTIVAGLFAPLAAGATILLPEADQSGDVAIGSGTVPEPESIDPERVL